MGLVTRVSFTHFYSMWNSRQGWGLVVVATIIIIMYARSKVKTFSKISLTFSKISLSYTKPEYAQ